MVNYNKAFISAIALASSLMAWSKGMEVSIINASEYPCVAHTVEIPVSDIKARIGDGPYTVVAGESAVPLQLTHDSLLIFQADLAPQSTVRYTIGRADSTIIWPTVATGRVYPERADDLAWENDLIAYRAYGPATQRNKERAFGYDIFFKHPSAEPMLDHIYGEQCSRSNWHTADSLRRISRQAYNEFVHTFSYHVDHGRGFDCYAVGPSLGAGAVARLAGDSIMYPWCYKEVEILDNGPIRFTARLRYEYADSVNEYRTIVLDAGKHLNKSKVQYCGVNDSITIVTGIPRRDDSATIIGKGFIAYADPTQGPDNGKALIGVKTTAPGVELRDIDKHSLMSITIAPTDVFEYYFGYAWSKADITDLEAWAKYLEEQDKESVIVSY